MDFKRYCANLLSKNKEHQRLIHLLNQVDVEKNAECAIQGLVGGSISLLISSLWNNLVRIRRFVIVSSDASEKEALRKDLSLFLPAGSMFVFPDFELPPFFDRGSSASILTQRFRVLHSLIRETNPMILLCSEQTLSEFVVPRRFILDNALRLKVNAVENRDSLTERLSGIGYIAVARVDVPGAFACRGEVMDIFSPNWRLPVRLRWNDGKITSMMFFNPDSQISQGEQILNLQIIPCSEVLNNFQSLEKGAEVLMERFGCSREVAMKHVEKSMDKEQDNLEMLLPLFHQEEECSLFDYLIPDDTLFFCLSSKLEMLNNLEASFVQLKMRHEKMRKHNMSALFEDWMVNPKDVVHKLFGSFVLTLETEQKIKSHDADSRCFVFPFEKTSGYSGCLEYFAKECKEDYKDLKVFVFVHSLKHEKLISMALEHGDVMFACVDDSLDFKDHDGSGVFLVREFLSSGFIWSGKVVWIAQNTLLGKKTIFHSRAQTVQSNPIRNFFDIRKGDFVVHSQHGVGRYLGVESVKCLNQVRDQMIIEYAEGGKLHVPAEKLFLVQKYIGSDSESEIVLDTLGSDKWRKKKEKIRKEVEVIAKQLVEMYCKRKVTAGFQFAPDTREQLALEASFLYEETVEQLRATEDIKADMESEKNMDRLLCGDVGFGKTEVAVRVVFKAVMSGKQVAVLCPTVLLATQHFRTFTERFSKFSVEVSLLSGLQSSREKKQIEDGLRSGTVDVLIGTHRILSSGIKFKDLGLLVVDEEHRFGVIQKEKLKMLRPMVDVLSISATPIPRTFQLSLTGLRDMSLMMSPPTNRLPVKNFVMEWSDEIVLYALEKELISGGQVFIVLNSISRIADFSIQIKKMIPKFKVEFAHAQMGKKKVEELMVKFEQHEFDVLISTTIIEAGIDIPNANTILVCDSHRMGLSQLYQLRGRVGRGGKQGYCYFLYPEDYALKEISQKRLSVLIENENLGSGFKIASHDLNFRGFGNVMGLKQSGRIKDVGMDMYYNLLNQAVQKIMLDKADAGSSLKYVEESATQFPIAKTALKHVEESATQFPIAKTAGIPFFHGQDVHIELRQNNYIPKEYVEDDEQRVEIYQWIAMACSREDLQDIERRLFDRFGPIPQAVLNYLALQELKLIGLDVGLMSIVESIREYFLSFKIESMVLEIENFLQLNQKYPHQVYLVPDKPTVIRVVAPKGHDRLREKIDFLKQILEHCMFSSETL